MFDWKSAKKQEKKHLLFTFGLVQFSSRILLKLRFCVFNNNDKKKRTRDLHMVWKIYITKLHSSPLVSELNTFWLLTWQFWIQIELKQKKMWNLERCIFHMLVNRTNNRNERQEKSMSMEGDLIFATLQNLSLSLMFWILRNPPATVMVQKFTISSQFNAKFIVQLNLWTRLMNVVGTLLLLLMTLMCVCIKNLHVYSCWSEICYLVS